MSNQAENGNKVAAMESKMMEMLSSTVNVSVSVQKELRTFEKRPSEAVATKPAEPDHVNLVPAQKSAKPVSSTGLIKNTAKFEALDSAVGETKQDLAFIQVRNEQFMSNQADNCNKMAAMESKMAAMESKMGEMLSSTANVSISVQKD